MADLWRKEGEQFFDDSGNVLNGGVLRYFDSGTSNPRTVYKDDGEVTSWGTTVTLDSAGRLTDAIYVTTGDFKETLENASATQIFENDEIPGALDTSSFLTTATFETPVLSKTADYTIVAGDAGKTITADPTGGVVELTLPSAATVGDGFRIHVIHVGTSNQVKLKPVSSQTINNEDGQVLTYGGQAADLVSDGANWHIDNQFGLQREKVIPVVDRDLLDDPASPTPGAWYILASTGTLLNDWASFSNNDLVQDDGQGGWIRYNLGADDEGIIADVADEDLLVRWSGTAWSLINDNAQDLLETLTFSSDSQYTTAIDTSTYPTIKIQWWNIQPDTDGDDFIVRTATGSVNSNVSYTGGLLRNTVITSSGFPDDNAGKTTSIALNQSIGANSVHELSSGEMTITRLGDAAYTHFMGQTIWESAAGAVMFGLAHGRHEVDTAYDQLYFTMSSGDIAQGTIKIIGCK